MPTFIPWSTFPHFSTWGLSILAPYVILVIGFIALKTHRQQHRLEKVFDIGWDSCILGIGIAATLMGGSEFQTILPNGAWMPLVFGGFTMALLYGLEWSQKRKVTQARLSVLAGTVGFGINTGMITWLNERKAYATVFWGILSFLVPFVASCLAIAKLNYPDPKTDPALPK